MITALVAVLSAIILHVPGNRRKAFVLWKLGQKTTAKGPFFIKRFRWPNQNSADPFARWSQTHDVLGVAPIVVQKSTTRCNHAFAMALRIEALDWFWANQRALSTFREVYSALPYKGRPSQRCQKLVVQAPGTGILRKTSCCVCFLFFFISHHWDYSSLAASTDEHGHQVSFLFINVSM